MFAQLCSPLSHSPLSHVFRCGVALSGLSALAFISFISCADPISLHQSGPRVEQSSSGVVVVGQTLELIGQGFLSPQEGVSRLYFSGQFIDAAEQTSPVELTVTPTYGGEVLYEEAAGELERQILTWSRVGPFNNPFTRDARHGRFTGTLQVLNSYLDGLEERGPAVPFNLNIGPSVTIERFEPIHTDCGAPAVRVIEGLPYRLKVRTSGLLPERFMYELSQINGAEGLTVFEHSYEGQVTSEDELGTSAELVVFNFVPEGQQAYVAELRVIAIGAEGERAETALPISVHRPLEVVYDGSFELAERFEPVPVSGCIPGGVGNNVSYSESISETRTQSVSMTIRTSWSNARGQRVSTEMTDGISVGESMSRSVSESLSEGEQLSESMGESYNQSSSNEVGFESSDGESWSWSLTNGESQDEYEDRTSSISGSASLRGSLRVKGEGSLGPITKASGWVTVSGGVKGGMSRGSTYGGSQTTSTERGYSMSGDSTQGSSFGSTLTEERSRRINGRYALGRDSEVTSSSSTGVSNRRTWDLSEEVSSSEVSKEATSESLRQTQVSSNSTEVTQSYGGYIPRGRYGIFYRQTTRWVRRALVRSFDLCGVAQPVGELQFNEWEWAPALALGKECDALAPPSTMPAVGCYITPCGE